MAVKKPVSICFIRVVIRATRNIMNGILPESEAGALMAKAADSKRAIGTALPVFRKWVID